MDHIPDVIYFKDRKGKLTMVNHAHAKGLGLKPEQVAGKTDFDFFPRKRAEKMARDDFYVMNSGKPIIDKVERATRPDGIDNYVSTTKIPRYGPNGKVIGLIGITRDITHRMQLKHLEDNEAHIKKKLEALEELNKLKSEFISAVSHELRTPLAIIKDSIGVIFDGLAGPLSNGQKKLLAKTNSNILRLQAIVAELLDISRIETGRLKLHYSLVNINDLILDSSQFFKKLAQERGIRLEYKLPKNGISIFVDTERVIQVMNNLLGNAIKFTEEGGHIRVEVKTLEDRSRIGVVDTGIGIARQDISKLFNKFMQVSKVTGIDRKGVGLGLSIAKDLVERHGGEIWAESKPGVGSKFYFTVPRFSGINALNKNVRDKLNSLLKEEKPVYLVNLSIVNFTEAKKKVKVRPEKLIADLKNIIELVFKPFPAVISGRNSHIISVDTRRGVYSIILPECTEEKTLKACQLLKERIHGYFNENKMPDIFINVGQMPYFSKERPAQQKIGNFFVKKIYIGFNKRRYKRVDYKLVIEVVFPLPEDGILPTETVDISQGGICFVSSRPIETDKQVEMKFKLPGRRNHLNIKGRVAWIMPLEGFPIPLKTNKYKVGVEFIGSKDKNRKNFEKFVKGVRND